MSFMPTCAGRSSDKGVRIAISVLLAASLAAACGGTSADDTVGPDSGADAEGIDAGKDASIADSGKDTSTTDSGSDAGTDASTDAATDASTDADVDAGPDASSGDSGVTCGSKMGFGYVSISSDGGTGSCGTGEDYACGGDKYEILCECPAETCTCKKNGSTVMVSSGYAGCPACTTPTFSTVAAGCGIPY